MTRTLFAACATCFALALVPGAASAAVPLTNVFNDPFTNSSSQHATAVEPDTFAHGSTIVMATQSGRFYDGGSSAIGFSTSTNGGASWTSGALPNITSQQNAALTYERVSDPSVAYDAAHATWMVSSIPILPSTAVDRVYVSRSTDGGLTWSNPSTVANASGSSDFDKNWTVCDNTSTSPFYGHCYTTWDDYGNGNRLLTATSTDGGLTWGAATPTANNATGLGGQPVVQPNGTVVVPVANANVTAILAYRSTDGGTTWSATTTVATAPNHAPAGNLRSDPLPSADVDGSGRVYVAWQDCRFRKGCKSNDIVYSSSTDGVTWSAVARVPIDATSSSVDHFIPGIAVEPGSSPARIGLTYYFYRKAACGSRRTPCQLEVGYIESADGGGTWSTHTDVAGPFPLTQIADTSQGRMVGDYISTSWSGGKAYGAFAVGASPLGSLAFNEGTYVPAGGLSAATTGFVNTAAGDRALPGAASDHAAPTSAIRIR